MTSRRYICIWLMVSYMVCGASTPFSCAESFSSREYKIKAGLIYNLTKFVEYTQCENQNMSPNFIVGILGEDPFQNEIEILNGKTVKGKNLIVKRYRTIEDVKDARILFVSASEAPRIPMIISRLRKRSILTISDMDHFSENGGMIHFITVNNRIRFRVNLNAVKHENLKLSAHFLKLVTIVE